MNWIIPLALLLAAFWTAVIVSWMVTVVLLPVAIWAVARFYLRGDDLSRYDGERPGGEPRPPSDAHFETVELLQRMGENAPKGPRRQRLKRLREAMDQMGEGRGSDAEIRSVDVAGVPGEWVLAPGADPDRRLLYLHGGAFVMGSPMSHRPITARLSEIAGASVLAVDYRLMPEHKRLDCLADCQTAYRWIIDHGPAGPAPVATLFVAGDSAGGNLTLALIAWARDVGLRRADAAVALSPATDATLSSPSILENLDSDHMLGPMFRPFAKLPKTLALWFGWLTTGVRPCDPRVSPAHGNLDNLPPTLVHASEAELLIDDARRYVNKARAAGSPAALETWHHVLHVWHIFEDRLPEAQAAFERIGVFLESVAPRRLSGEPSTPQSLDAG